jgi:hypothetical protein
MPRNRAATGEQWETCDRCGREYPTGRIGTQSSSLYGRLRVCYERCWDDLTNDSPVREKAIAEILGQGADREGADLRFVDAAIQTREDF